MKGNGIVYLVGAGPGDPGLLTLRGAQLIKRAEVLVYDYLAAPAILNLAPAACRLIYVGKMAGNHAKSQDEINKILVEEARKGQIVVRLKGGDPYIFGRGGEEGLVLADAGIVFEEVPGISSTIAAAAYAGIPLTHRDLSSQAALITGHENADKNESVHNWEALSHMGTISMVMGVANLGRVCRALINNGRLPATPAALIQWGTTTRQRTVTGTLHTLPQLAEKAQIGPPALFVAGEVVNLRERLNWFEKKPLFGLEVLVTRSRNQASQLSQALAELGAGVKELPTIAIEPLFKEPSEPEFAKILNNMANYNWLVFTSPNGAEIFFSLLFKSGADARQLAGLKIAVIGSGTAAVLKQFGLKPDLMPEKFVADSLLEALIAAGPAAGRRFLLLKALEGRDVLPEGLREAGALEVAEAALYKTIHPENLKNPENSELLGNPGLVTFTSSSTALGLADLVPENERQNFPAASIGPITSQTARELGFPVVAEAENATIPSLCEAILKWRKGS